MADSRRVRITMKYSFYQKKTEKSDRLNVFIITFATLIKNKSRNKDYDEVLSTYSHIHVYHDP